MHKDNYIIITATLIGGLMLFVAFSGGCTASDFVPLVPHKHHTDDPVAGAQPGGQRWDPETNTLQPSGIGWAMKVFDNLEAAEMVTGGGAIAALLGMLVQHRRKNEAVCVARERGDALNRAKASMPPEQAAEIEKAEQVAHDVHKKPPKESY